MKGNVILKNLLLVYLLFGYSPLSQANNENLVRIEINFKKFSSKKICTGVFIRQNIVITAKHCLIYNNTQVSLGDLKLFPENGGAHELQIKEIILHNGGIYDSHHSSRINMKYLNNDLGIIIVSPNNLQNKKNTEFTDIQFSESDSLNEASLFGYSFKFDILKNCLNSSYNFSLIKTSLKLRFNSTYGVYEAKSPHIIKKMKMHSGGPVFDKFGNYIGLLSSGSTTNQILYIIPLHSSKFLEDEIQKHDSL